MIDKRDSTGEFRGLLENFQADVIHLTRSEP